MTSSFASGLRTRLLLVALAIAAVLVLTGCLGGETLGSDDDGPSTPPAALDTAGVGPQAAVLAAAATRTGEAGSVRVAATLALVIPGEADRVKINLVGAFDLEKQRGRLALDYGNLLAALGPGAQQASAFLPDQMVFDEDAVYLRMPNLAQISPDAKKWVKLDVDELSQQQGLNVGGVEQLGQADPAQLLALLESVDGSIEELGQEAVRGQQATHYRAVVDMVKLLGAAPPEQQEALQAQLDQLSAMGLDNLPVEVWIDESDRVVKMSSTIAVPDTGTGAGTVALDIEFYDFGAPVKIKTPAKNNVTSLDKLLGGFSPAIQG